MTFFGNAFCKVLEMFFCSTAKPLNQCTGSCKGASVLVGVSFYYKKMKHLG